MLAGAESPPLSCTAPSVSGGGHDYKKTSSSGRADRHQGLTGLPRHIKQLTAGATRGTFPLLRNLLSSFGPTSDSNAPSAKSSMQPPYLAPQGATSDCKVLGTSYRAGSAGCSACQPLQALPSPEGWAGCFPQRGAVGNLAPVGLSSPHARGLQATVCHP